MKILLFVFLIFYWFASGEKKKIPIQKGIQDSKNFRCLIFIMRENSILSDLCIEKYWFYSVVSFYFIFLNAERCLIFTNSGCYYQTHQLLIFAYSFYV